MRSAPSSVPSIAEAASVDAFLLRLAAVEEDEEGQEDRRDRRQQHGQQLVAVLHAANLRRQLALALLHLLVARFLAAR